MIKLINMVKGQLSKGKNVILTFEKRICVLQILGCNGDTASVKYDHGDNIDTITGANKAIYKVDIKDIMMYICRCNYKLEDISSNESEEDKQKAIDDINNNVMRLLNEYKAGLPKGSSNESNTANRIIVKGFAPEANEDSNDEDEDIEKDGIINTLMNSITRWNNDGIVVSIYDREDCIIATMVPKRDIVRVGEVVNEGDIHICIESNSQCSPFNNGDSVIVGNSYDIPVANIADIIISNGYKVMPLVHCCDETLNIMEIENMLHSGVICSIIISAATNADAEKDECIAYISNLSSQNTFVDVHINDDEGSYYKRWYIYNRLIPSIKYYGGIEIGERRYTISTANLSEIIKSRKLIVC